jgi:hypothetical protein
MDYPRMLFAGVNAMVESLEGCADQDKAQRVVGDLLQEQFNHHKLFLADFLKHTLFGTLLERLKDHTPDDDDSVVDNWRRAFNFVSDFFLPHNFLSRLSADALNSSVDVMCIC